MDEDCSEPLIAYVHSLARQLLLADWRIRIAKGTKEEEDEQNELACVEFRELGEANITLYPSFFLEPKESQREIVVHELLHIHQRKQFEVVESTKTALGKKAFELLDTFYLATEEATVQTLARIIAPSLPLP